MANKSVYEKFDADGPTGEEYVRVPGGYMYADDYFGAGGSAIPVTDVINPDDGESLVAAPTPGTR